MGKFERQRKEKEGLKAKQLLNKVQQDLNNIQLQGKERIVFIIEKLEQELINQGYDVDDGLIALWRHPGYKIELQVGSKRIGGQEIGN
ncbi:hypothetical protein N4T77_16960 [Clostridium sp. CX1]|uniref:hypothetical protein n=1 Tax=Clostridium sp. CX1 TaxID=2978346 RepID=UPI0021BF3CD8|nr:hypothetical protein [Clostridium sp. CX1]MCT8978280.1 hypothetical protein [Clostridium sp. CX1]